MSFAFDRFVHFIYLLLKLCKPHIWFLIEAKTHLQAFKLRYVTHIIVARLAASSGYTSCCLAHFLLISPLKHFGKITGKRK